MSEEANASTESAEATAAAATEGADANVTDAAATADAAAEQEAAEGKDAEKAGDAEAGEEAFSLAAPEGAEAFQADFDAFAGDMDAWLKANPNATAREALTEAAMRQARVAGDAQKQMLEQRNAQLDAWAGDLRKDAEFGGEKYDANVATAVKGLEAVGSPELRKMLDETGLGSHPDVVRAFWKVGQMVADTAVVTGQTGTSTRRSFADALYGNGNGKD
ncbi:hypothetical protein [Paracoccus sp. (in: a-proteobacteria)]|uniref:hypothetical protein n=1 Tax=Paracoccus sp. TaxID=267 RepID=UPI002AFE6D72|nr:hypothetical protein [Paracoccus sp. (in: a-proteobacteria)]